MHDSKSAVNFGCFSEQPTTSAEASSEISFIIETQCVFLETKTTRFCYNQLLLSKFYVYCCVRSLITISNGPECGCILEVLVGWNCQSDSWWSAVVE